MFSPKCKSEYQEGVVICCDCNISLVSALKREPKLEFVDYEEILFTNNAADIAVIKSLFDSEGIVYYFLGEHFAFPIRLMVNKDQAQEARELLRDLGRSCLENDSSEDSDGTEKT
ncbi:MAG TPA: hypothetical protein DCY12_10790 [Candidatus Atribacteria bacterium]|nr:hypothetical protein [Candidatus Atribacteria bacterium]